MRSAGENAPVAADGLVDAEPPGTGGCERQGRGARAAGPGRRPSQRR
jgi:hypothetical protein